MSTTFQTSLISKSYNGYANYETWNAALWIQNDYGLYSIALRCDDYAEFQELMNVTSISDVNDLGMSCTPDGVLWNDRELNHIELDEVIANL